MILRPVTQEDVPACAAIVRRWLDSIDWMPASPSEAELRGYLAEGFPNREVWVYGTPAEGYLSLDPERCHISGFYVAEPGRGRGRALLDRAKSGRTRLSLNSHEANEQAHRFYAREGFVEVARGLEGNDGIPEIRMEWRA